MAAPDPQPLPPNPYADQLWRNAYDSCLRVEERALLGKVPYEVVSARLLGYMILEAPVDVGRTIFAQEVLSCATDQKLFELAEYYINHFVRCFRSAKGPTPSPSLHPSRPSFDDTSQTLKYLLSEAPKDHRAAKEKALARDRYRCVLTRAYDTKSYMKYVNIRELVVNSRAQVTVTNAAHIFPSSTNSDISGANADGHKHDYAAGVWAVMSRFGNVHVANELNGSAIHRLENIITMDAVMHTYFDQLMIWFEEVDGEDNRYRVCAVDEYLLSTIPERIITFTSIDPTNLPLPSRDYLRLHAACCRVANLSGAGQYLENMFRDEEEMRTLSKDGSSAEVLVFALSRLVSVC